jgi:hypothetical protein
VSSNVVEDVQFHLDRSQEAVLTLLRSILSNPRLAPEEQFVALKAIGSHYRTVAELVEGKLREGEKRGLQLAATHLSRN